MGNQAAGQRLHADEAHVLFLAQAYQRFFLFTGKVGEGELKRIIQAGKNGFLGHVQTVVGDADMADEALLFGFQHGVVQSDAVAGARHIIGIVELVDIDVIGFEQAQAGVQVLPEFLHRFGMGFGGDDDAFAHVGKRVAHLFLAVGIGTGGVKIVDAVVIGFAQQITGFIHGYALHGQCAETVFIHNQIGASKTDGIHRNASLC